MTTIPSAEYLRQRLRYEPETGKLFWLPYYGGKRPASWNAKHAGKEAFKTKSQGYLQGAIDGVKYYAHRIIWVLVTGKYPPTDRVIDHKNCKRSDNRWVNLRLASFSNNVHNIPKPKDNTSGFKGVYFNKKANKWQAYLTLNKKYRYLGIFEKLEDAVQAHRNAVIEYHGDFARIE